MMCKKLLSQDYLPLISYLYKKKNKLQVEVNLLKNKTFLFVSFAILLVFSSTFIVKGATIVNDPANDIQRIYWNSATQLPTSEDGVSKPEIDILSLDWGKTSDGNVTISLSFAGTPKVGSNTTFYMVSVSHDESNLSILLWTGAYLGYSNDNPSYTFITYGMALSGTKFAPVVSGNAVIWTLPRSAQTLNYTSFTYDDVALNLPDTPDPTWEWTATAWTGTVPYSASFSSQEGEWWMDTTDSSETGTNTNTVNGNGTSNSNNSGTATSNGFELITFLSIGLIIVLKKRK